MKEEQRGKTDGLHAIQNSAMTFDHASCGIRQTASPKLESVLQ
jgi:hypothetical protein